MYFVFATFFQDSGEIDAGFSVVGIDAGGGLLGAAFFAISFPSILEALALHIIA
jgi:hypothetical protein